MPSTRFHFRLLAAFCLALLLSPPLTAQIFADVTVEGAVNGTFTISLEYQKTPGAVANFVGLATGRRSWLDRTSGAIRSDGFYNGVAFHRVIAGFVSQTGSRAGDGTDGPGYSFRNEIDGTLTHNAAYVVAMANSGKDTNGSQFYITASAQPALNGSYTVFGHVTAGTAVCDAINATPTTGAGGSPADRPLTPVKITGISVYGPGYAGFSLTQPTLLPVLRNSQPILQRTSSTFVLNYDHAAFSDYFVYQSADLSAWLRFASGYFAVAPVGTLDVTSQIGTSSRFFFRFGRADYSTCHTTPPSLAGKTLSFPALFGTIFVFNAAGNGGSVTYTGGGSSTFNAAFTPNIYTATLDTTWAEPKRILFDRLDYNSSGTGGTYVARTNVNGYSSVSGTFTSSP